MRKVQDGENRGRCWVERKEEGSGIRIERVEEGSVQKE